MDVKLQSGEEVRFHKHENGYWHCPVCGSPGLENPPYYEKGEASFEMCSCDFEYGFDDNSDASSTATSTVVGSWEKWRNNILQQLCKNSPEYNIIKSNLATIGVSIAT